MSSTDYVPMSNWSKDHWSTLAYVETVMVECGGFQVGADPRMKSNRRHFRVMSEECPRPRRPVASRAPAMAMLPEHATRLNDSSVVAGHDDWMCVQDMAVEGLFTADIDGVQPGQTLHLSERGQSVVAALRAHKAAGGNFASFDQTTFLTQATA